MTERRELQIDDIVGVLDEYRLRCADHSNFLDAAKIAMMQAELRGLLPAGGGAEADSFVIPGDMEGNGVSVAEDREPAELIVGHITVTQDRSNKLFTARLHHHELGMAVACGAYPKLAVSQAWDAITAASRVAQGDGR